MCELSYLMFLEFLMLNMRSRRHAHEPFKEKQVTRCSIVRKIVIWVSNNLANFVRDIIFQKLKHSCKVRDRSFAISTASGASGSCSVTTPVWVHGRSFLTLRLVSSLGQNGSICRVVKGKKTRSDIENLSVTSLIQLKKVHLTLTDLWRRSLTTSV